jgi:membrane protease subunit (stomatin/prohibitin family)
MARKQLALLAAALGVTAPVHAFDTRNDAQTVMFYYAVPLDARSKKERNPWMGMQINGKRDYQTYSMDAPLYTFNVAEGGAAEASLIVIGAVAVGAAVAVASKGKSSQQQVQQQQQTQQAQQAAKPPSGTTTTPTPCPQSCP